MPSSWYNGKWPFALLYCCATAGMLADSILPYTETVMEEHMHSLKHNFILKSICLLQIHIKIIEHNILLYNYRVAWGTHAWFYDSRRISTTRHIKATSFGCLNINYKQTWRQTKVMVRILVTKKFPPLKTNDVWMTRHTYNARPEQPTVLNRSKLPCYMLKRLLGQVLQYAIY